MTKIYVTICVESGKITASTKARDLEGYTYGGSLCSITNIDKSIWDKLQPLFGGTGVPKTAATNAGIQSLKLF